MTSRSESGVTRALARYLAGAKLEEIPADVRHEGKRALLNWFGCAVAGSQTDTVTRAAEALAPFFGPGTASFLGHSTRLDPGHAALLNGISSHVLDFDDTHDPTLIHPSSAVIPAALAVAEWTGATGAAFLHAAILGLEVACRAARAVFPEHYDRGFHITGTAGAFGAAGAAGRLLGLDETRMAWALGIAGTQAAGLREMFGTMCKSLHPGRAAQNGITAAVLASAGFTSSEHVFEAQRGFAHVLSKEPNLDSLIDGLGERFELLRNTYKPFACGLVAHPVIEGCLSLREQDGLRAEDVERIRLYVSRRALELTGKATPRTGLEAKFSIFHSAAVAILDGAAGELQYADDRATASDVVALRERIQAELDPALREMEARVVAVTKDGSELTRTVTNVRGSLHRPLTDRQIEAKATDLMTALGAEGAQKIASLCWAVDQLSVTTELTRAATL